MAAITGSTGHNTVPGNDRLLVCVLTPATADSADTIDLSEYGGNRVISSNQHSRCCMGK